MQKQVGIYGGIKNDAGMLVDYARRQAHWKNSKVIHFNRCLISGIGFTQMAKLGLDKLGILDLSDDEITESSIKGIKISHTVLAFRNLTFMSLDRNKIGCAGAKLLTRIQMPLLNTLYLGFGQIGSEGAKHLAKASWPKLFTLSIDYSFIKLDGFVGLMANNWRKYQSMYIGQNNLSAIEFMQLVSSVWTNAKLNNFWTWRIQEDMEDLISKALENRYPNGSLQHWGQEYQQQQEYEEEEQQQEQEQEQAMEDID